MYKLQEFTESKTVQRNNFIYFTTKIKILTAFMFFNALKNGFKNFFQSFLTNATFTRGLRGNI